MRRRTFGTAGRLFRATALAVVLAPAFGMPARAQDGPASLIGVLTDEGVQCPALRGDDGALYTLVPKTKLGLLQPGDRVRVSGRIAQVSRCQQGITIEIATVDRAN